MSELLDQLREVQEELRHLPLGGRGHIPDVVLEACAALDRLEAMVGASQKIVGYCPMGCGQTLFVGDGGHITCAYVECPNPGAVNTILSDAETEHLVTFGEATFVVQHPLRERIDGQLHECELHQILQELDGPPVKPGRYRAVRRTPDASSEAYRRGIGWDFEELSPT